MHPNFLAEKLLTVIILLVLLYFLQMLLTLIIPLFAIENVDILTTLAANSVWFCNIVFGLVIFWLTRKKGLLAIFIGILAIVLPTYGSIFYMIATLQYKSEND